MIQQNRGGVFAGEDQAQQHVTSWLTGLLIGRSLWQASGVEPDSAPITEELYAMWKLVRHAHMLTGSKQSWEVLSCCELRLQMSNVTLEWPSLCSLQCKSYDAHKGISTMLK